MGLYDHWPYTNFHELNLTWLLRLMEELSNKVDNFVALNTIKYADPIQWNITTQYEANTVVVNPQSGTAYLSSQPVPAGVLLTNTDYWSVIFTLDVISSNKNITLRDDGSNVLATFASNIGDWLIWNGNLYKVTRQINVNEAYVSGYNLDRYTVELFIADAKTALMDEITNRYDAIMNKIGDLDDLNTQTKVNLVAAINEIYAKVSSVQENINIYNVKNYGVMGDGVSDDTDAINDLIDDIEDGSALYFPEGTYMIREVKDDSVSGNNLSTHELYEASLGIHIQNRNDIQIIGAGKSTILKGIDPAGCIYGNIINVENSTGIIIKDLTVYGNLQTHVNVCNTGNLKDEWLYGINFWKDSKNCLVDNVRCEQCHADGINLHDDFQRYMINIHIRDCTFYYCGRNGIQCGKSKITFIDNCTSDHMTGAQTTGCAVDCEAHDYVTENIYINNCTWTNTVQGVAFNTIKNAIVSDCYGDTLWNQSRKVYHGVTFDRGFGVIVNNVHGLTDVRATDGTHFYDCDISRLSIYSNLDNTQGNDEFTIANCNVPTLVFYGNFDGNMMITGNKIGMIDIEPNFTVNGLNIISNYLEQLVLRMSGDVNIIGNTLISPDGVSTQQAIRTLGTGTHKLIGNNIKAGTRSASQQINMVGDSIKIVGNTIEDTRGSGNTCLVATAPDIDIINNYVDASGVSSAIQVVCSGTPLVDGNITKSISGITFTSGTNPAGAVNRNYNI